MNPIDYSRKIQGLPDDLSTQSPSSREIELARKKKTAPTQTATTISKASQAERIAFTGTETPTLAPTKAIQFDAEEVSEEEAVEAALDGMIELLQELETIVSETSIAGTAAEVELAVPEAEKEKGIPTTSLRKYLAQLSSVLLTIKKLKEDIELDLEGKKRNLELAVIALDKLNKSGLDVEKLLLIAELEALKGTARHTESGPRVFLGERPDLVLRLYQAGISPPTFHVHGGPFNGTVKKMVAEGTPPYDNPIYAEMAEGGDLWYDVHVSSVDQTIRQIVASMSPPEIIKVPKFFTSVNLSTQTILVRSFIPIFLFMPSVILTKKQVSHQLKVMMKVVKKNKNVKLGKRPDLMLKLVTLGIKIPVNPSAKSAGSAKKAAEKKVPPYNNPIYAAMAHILPAGWEELTTRQVKTLIKQIDASTQGRMKAIKMGMMPIVFTPIFMSAQLPLALAPLVDKKVMKVLMDVQRLGYKRATHHLSFFFLTPSQKEVVRMLTASVAITQAIFLAVNPPPKEMRKFGVQSLECWVNQQMAVKLVGNLYGFSGASLFERELMANALVSFALVSTLITAYRPSPKELISTLQQLATIKPYAQFAAIAIVLVEAQRQTEIAAMKNIIKELLKGIEADQRQLENLSMLEALIENMIKQLMQMLQEKEGESIAEPVFSIQA